MADIGYKWGNPTSLTITLNSLASSSLRQSDRIDLATSRAIDVIFNIDGLALASGSGTEFFNFYIAADIGTAARAAGNVGTSDAAFSGREEELIWLDSVSMNGTTEVEFTTRGVAGAFDGILPEGVVLVCENQGTVALASSGITIEYVIAQGESV